METTPYNGITKGQTSPKSMLGRVFKEFGAQFQEPRQVQMGDVNFESTKHKETHEKGVLQYLIEGNDRKDQIMQVEQIPPRISTQTYNPVLKKTQNPQKGVAPLWQRQGQFRPTNRLLSSKRPLADITGAGAKPFQPEPRTREELVDQVREKPVIVEPDFGPHAVQAPSAPPLTELSLPAQAALTLPYLRAQQERQPREGRNSHAQPSQSNQKPPSPNLQGLKLKLDQRPPPQQNQVDASISALLNSYVRQQDSNVFTQKLKEKQLQQQKLSKAKYLFEQAREQQFERREKSVEYLDLLDRVQVTKRHQLQGCSDISMGGWLDHIGCVWRVADGAAAAEEVIQPEQRTGCTLVITKPRKDQDDELFRQAFEFKITFVQCFKIPKAKGQDTKSNSLNPLLGRYRILVFTTDLIYQLQVEASAESLSEEQVQQSQKQVVVIRDDELYAPMWTAQVNYWVAKQHASGLIVAGGASEKRAQAAEIWLSSEPEQAQFGQSIKPIVSFFSDLATNKRSKTIPIKYNQTSCPQDGFVSSLWNLFNGIQPNQTIASIAFGSSSPDSKTSAMALLVNDSNFPALSKINFYTVPCLPSDQRDYNTNQIFRSSVTFKQIVEKVRAIVQPQDHQQHSKQQHSIIPKMGNLAAIQPIHITYIGHSLQILLKNGMVLLMAVNANYEISIEDIVLSPIERAIQIKKQMGIHSDERDVGHFAENQEFHCLNPIFPQSSGCLRFTGDAESVDHFKCCQNSQMHTQFEIQKSCTFNENETQHEVYIVSKPAESQTYLMYIQRNPRKQATLVGSCPLPSDFITQAVQIICPNKVHVLSRAGHCLKVELQSQLDLVCQFLHLKDRFERQNHQKLFSNQPNLAMDGQRGSSGSAPLLEHLNIFLDDAFSQLLQDYRDSKRQQIQMSQLNVIKDSELYQFMEDLLNVQCCRSYVRSSKTDRFYVARGGRGYVQFMQEHLDSQDDHKGLNTELVRVQLKQDVRDQAQMLLMQIAEKYFDAVYWQSLDHEIVDQHIQEHAFAGFEKFDLHATQYEDLRLEKCSMRGQVKYSLVLGHLMQLLGPLLSQRLFSFNNVTKQLELMKWLNIDSLRSIHITITDLLKSASVLFKSHHASLFSSLITLLKLLAEGLAFLLQCFHHKSIDSIPSSSEYSRSYEPFSLNNGRDPSRQSSFLSSGQAALKIFLGLKQTNFAKITQITLEDYLLYGTQSPGVMSVIETCISHDQTLEKEQILRDYPHFLSKEVVELTLARKYLEQASEVLISIERHDDLSQQSTLWTWPFGTQRIEGQCSQHPDNEYREQILHQALGYLLDNTLYIRTHSELQAILKLLIQNRLYKQAIGFCINKAQDSMQAQTFWTSMASGDQELMKDAKVLRAAQGEEYLLRVGEVEKKLEDLEIQKLNCFTFVVELLEIVIERLMRESQRNRENEQARTGILKDSPIATQAAGQELARSIQPQTILQSVANAARSSLGVDRGAIFSLFCKRVHPQRARRGQETAHSRPSSFFADLYPATYSSPRITKTNTVSAATVMFERQLRKLETAELAQLKEEILKLISAKDVPSKNKEQATDYGLDLLHRAVFQLLIQNGLIEDLFKIKSSHLQEFIENELWMYDQESQNRADIRIGKELQNINMEAENREGSEELRAKKFAAILRATSKHFMAISQPLNLFHYLYEALVAASEPGKLDKYYLNISDRISWLQQAVACVDEGSICVSSLSAETHRKKEQVLHALKLHHLQKMVSEKLNKISITLKQSVQNEAAQQYRDCREADLDDRCLEHFGMTFQVLIDHQIQFSYLPILDVQQMLDVANQCRMFGLQLRILSVLPELSSHRQSPEEAEARACLSRYVWTEFIKAKYIDKCFRHETLRGPNKSQNNAQIWVQNYCPKGHQMNYEISTTKIMCDKCRKHIKENEYYQHCPTDKENYHWQCVPHYRAKKFWQKLERYERLFEAPDKEFIALTIVDLTQKHLMLLIKENRVTFERFFSSDLYWFTSSMIPESSDFSEALPVFEMFNRHLNSLLLSCSQPSDENSALLLAEPMKYFTVCMIINRIAELPQRSPYQNLPGRQLLVIEANKVATALSRCFEGDMELLYSGSVVQAYQALAQQLQSNIETIAELKH